MVNKNTSAATTASSKTLIKANGSKSSKVEIKPKTPAKVTKKVPVPEPVDVTPPSKIKSKEKKIIAPGSVTKSAKKSWQRRPKPAHSGVPAPEKLKKLLQKQIRDDSSF